MQRAKWTLRRATRRADPLLDLFDPRRTRYFPKDYDRIEAYKERFTDTARVFDLFVKRSESIEPGLDGHPVVVAVMPWFGTPAPWYAVAVGLGLARRGRRVVFLWHDTAYPELSASLRHQDDEIRSVLRRLERRFPVLRLSDQSSVAARPEPGDELLLDRLTEANLMWRLRGGIPTAKDDRFRVRVRDHLADALPRIRSLMRSDRFRYMVVPGGVIGPSGLYLEAGQDAGVRVATFDAGLGWTIVNTSGVAAQQTDLPRAFELLTAGLRGGDKDVTEAAQEEFSRRRSGSDLTRYQMAPSSTRDTDAEGSVLIPLSVVFDAAALGRHRVFADTEQWLRETIRVLLDETRVPIIVRQHPSERRATERSSFDVESMLHESFGSQTQLRFIAAEDDVSTYDLLDSCRLVLPFVSTIGIEAAALGKPVIISGDVYYGGLGFVWSASSRGEYFDLIRRGARGELPLLPDQVSRAWCCYYLNAVCQRVWTNFTPQPPDFWRWVARTPDELYGDPAVEDILTSIDQDVPLSMLRHERRMLIPSR
jgi:hypothetical protein